MGSKSDAWEVDILKMVTGQNSSIVAANPATTPMVPWIGLYTVMTADGGTFTEVPTSFAYTRVNSATKWAAPTSGQPSSVSNNGVITFPTASGGAWGTIVGFAIHTAQTGGSMLMWGTLTASKLVGDGDTASFAVSSLTLTED